MSQDNKDIQGSQTVSRHQTVGGNASVGGSMVIGHHLMVKGWLDAPNVKSPLKGLYATAEDLKRAYPRPLPGWFALVGDTLPADVWRSEHGEWVATGKSGGEFNIYLDRVENDIEDLQEQTSDLKEGLDDLQEQTAKLGKDLEEEAATRERIDNSIIETTYNLRITLESTQKQANDNARQIDYLFDVTSDLSVDCINLQKETSDLKKETLDLKKGLEALEGAWIEVADEDTAEQMAKDGLMEKGKVYYTVEEDTD